MFGRVTDMTRCLVIEACGKDRSRTVDLLQDLGFDVSGSHDTDEAVTAIQINAPQVILIEERGDGKETAATLIRLRAAARGRGKDPLILVCASDPRSGHPSARPSCTAHRSAWSSRSMLRSWRASSNNAVWFESVSQLSWYDG